MDVLVQLAIAVSEEIDFLQQAVVMKMNSLGILSCLKVLKDASLSKSVCLVKFLLQVCDLLCLWPLQLQRGLCNLDTVPVLLVLTQQGIAGSTQVCIGSEEDSSFIQAQVLVDLLVKSGGLHSLQLVSELLILMVELLVGVDVAAKRYRPV